MLAGRVSPELEEFLVKWAPHLPYAVATALLKETSRVDHAISISGLRNCGWAIGQELNDVAESAMRGERAYPLAKSKVGIVALAVDSAWSRHRLLSSEQDKVKHAQHFPQSVFRLAGDT